MSNTQWEHMAQQNYLGKFTSYSSTFETDQMAEEIDVTGIQNRMVNIYPEADATCDLEINQSLLDTVPG